MSSQTWGAPAPEQGRSPRGRRAARPSGDAREAAILTTAEQLLQTRTLAEVSIDDLARGAGISRPTFYFYFASKDAVLLALIDRVVQEAARRTAEVVPLLAGDPAQGWRAVITVFHETFRAHRGVALAIAEAQFSNRQARTAWNTVMERWVQATSDAIQAERDRGAAPPGLPARDLAVALNHLNERALHSYLAGDQPSLSEEAVVPTLLTIWLRTIYGAAGSTA